MTATACYELARLVRRHGDRVVLDIAALRIEQGEVFGLVGPTGAGKTTLLHILAGVLERTSGSLAFAGQPVARGYTAADQRRVTMVFQRPAMLRGTVHDNVGAGLRFRGTVDQAKTMAALERVGLAHLARREARSLSGGEMQLLAVARALIVDPAVLLLDEPTASLDPRHVSLIEEVVAEAWRTREVTVVWATHNLFQARRCATRVALLLEGALVEVAPAAELFGNPRDARTRAFVRGEMVY
jgi:tungstate transport system ATP-binding protein